MATFRPRCRAQLTVKFDGRGGPDKTITIECAPRAATVRRNSYAEADTWSLEVDARVLPFDPDLIASCAARIYMWSDDGHESKEWATESNEMIRGLADDIGLVFGEGQALGISGRDYTGILDPEWDPRQKVPSGKPLDQTIQDIADAAAPETTSARFLVAVQSTRSMPICGGLQRSTKKKGLFVKQGKTHWDVIYDLAIAHGFIVFVRDSTIVISDPREHSARTIPFAPRVAYGRHLTSLEVERKFAKERVPQIKISAWDPKTKKPVTVLYPEHRTDVTTAIGLKKDEILRYPPQLGVTDREGLRAQAKAWFDNLARAESTYKFKTLYLEIPIGAADLLAPSSTIGSASFDLLRLDTGSAVSIAFDPFNREAMRALTAGQRVEHLEAMGYAPTVASFVADNYDRLEQFRQPYYCQGVEFTYSHDEGLTIEVDAANFACEPRELAVAP